MSGFTMFKILLSTLKADAQMRCLINSTMSEKKNDCDSKLRRCLIKLNDTKQLYTFLNVQLNTAEQFTIN